jgi:prepilin-type N-terminal cleavage/methylation domain-containing protein
MYGLKTRPRQRSRDDAGFTLPELVMTVAIVGIIVAGLAGVVIRYLQDTVDTQARLTESHDVQFAAAYWQRDVASIGIRKTNYEPANHTFELKRSVVESDELADCSLPGGNPIVTLAWSDYDSLDSTADPRKVTVTYLTEADGSVYKLFRVRCTGGTVDSTVEVAHNLRVVPKIECTDADGDTDCEGAGQDVPTIVTLPLEIRDPEGRGTASYTAKLIGERRQT